MALDYPCSGSIARSRAHAPSSAASHWTGSQAPRGPSRTARVGRRRGSDLSVATTKALEPDDPATAHSARRAPGCRSPAARGGVAGEAQTKKATATVRTVPPPWVATMLLARGEWRFPQLDGISDAPVFRADGTMHDDPCDDPRTRIIRRCDPPRGCGR